MFYCNYEYPVGDGGGGGDGSSGNSSDDNRPVQIAGGQVTLDVLRGLGMMPAPQARRPSQGSSRDPGETDAPDPVRESIPGHEEANYLHSVLMFRFSNSDTLKKLQGEAL